MAKVVRPKSAELEARTLRLLPELWDAIESEADRCERSVNGQITAILKDYFGLANVHARTIYTPSDSQQESHVEPIAPTNQRRAM